MAPLLCAENCLFLVLCFIISTLFYNALRADFTPPARDATREKRPDT